MEGLILNTKSIHPDEKGCRSIVRVKTSIWKDKSGLHYQRDLIKMKRLSWDYQILEEDCDNMGASEVVKYIINLFEIKDGLYEVVTCNNRASCWESPVLDEYDYKLIPFNKNTDK